ncbi:hypothetical protein [Couchioplanes caeruleus]|uniref:Peptidase inhibitor family I36 n=2 Tax=Couchioplanes caeruleus TaxID=56438 RepID=A0A1K0GHX0_9ACTN|nr:hypothetical protein [Couchioplanes caeruleus]OJF10516.1 hypothetical protein BG844_31315 [Couchioplanes caeruleus subsp. caeruleus]ROP28602.1 hypothetical protein EDD30_1367 [Couchioplanes caeruleus]
MRRNLKAGLGALVISAAFAGLWAAPASASNVNQGSNYAQHSYDGTYFEYCDYEDDNHSVWVNYYTDASTSMRSTESVNGAGNCNAVFLSSVLTNLRVVEDNPSSSTNYYGAWHGYPVAGS